MITKIGAYLQQQEDKTKDTVGLGHLAAGLGGMATLEASSRKVAPLLREDSGKLTTYEADQLTRMMGGNRKIRVSDPSESPFSSRGPRYSPDDHTVYADKSGYAFAHEMGHATSPLAPRKHRGIRLGHAFLTTGVNNLSPLINIGTTLGQRASDNETTRKVLGAVDTATQVATAANLAEEAQASIRALRAINKLKGRAAALQAARIYVPAFGTYLGQAGFSHGLVPWLTNKAYDLVGGE